MDTAKTYGSQGHSIAQSTVLMGRTEPQCYEMQFRFAEKAGADAVEGLPKRAVRLHASRRRIWFLTNLTRDENHTYERF